MGFDVARFESKVPEEFICTICHDVLQDPLVTPVCEHVFCRECISGWLTGGPSKAEPSCPNDRQPASVDSLRPPLRSFRNLLNSLRIRCLFAGCGEYVPLQSSVEHEDECIHNPANMQKEFRCPENCGAMITVAMMEKHNCISFLKRQLRECETKRTQLADQYAAMEETLLNMRNEIETKDSIILRYDREREKTNREMERLKDSLAAAATTTTMTSSTSASGDNGHNGHNHHHHHHSSSNTNKLRSKSSSASSSNTSHYPPIAHKPKLRIQLEAAKERATKSDTTTRVTSDSALLDLENIFQNFATTGASGANGATIGQYSPTPPQSASSPSSSSTTGINSKFYFSSNPNLNGSVRSHDESMKDENHRHRVIRSAINLFNKIPVSLSSIPALNSRPRAASNSSTSNPAAVPPNHSPANHQNDQGQTFELTYANQMSNTTGSNTSTSTATNTPTITTTTTSNSQHHRNSGNNNNNNNNNNNARNSQHGATSPDLMELIQSACKKSKIVQVMSLVNRRHFYPNNDYYKLVSTKRGAHSFSIWYEIRLLEVLEPYISAESKILDIGSGYGFITVCIAQLARQVIGVEHVKELVNKANEIVDKHYGRLREENRVNFERADGRYGCQRFAPYDMIVIEPWLRCNIPDIIFNQLKPNGCVVAVLRTDSRAQMCKITLNQRRQQVRQTLISDHSYLCAQHKDTLTDLRNQELSIINQFMLSKRSM